MHFARRYTNESYNISLYLNMARLLKAEQELNEMLEEGGKLLKEVTWIWISNTCWTVYCATTIVRRWREEKAFKARMQKKVADDQALGIGFGTPGGNQSSEAVLQSPP